MPNAVDRSRNRRRSMAEALEPRVLMAVQFLGDVDPTPSDSDPTHFTRFGDSLYFFAEDAAGRELWKTDGTPGGTARFADINPGRDDAVSPQPLRSLLGEPEEIVAAGGTLFFTATHGPARHSDLYQTDGTAAGTVLVNGLDTLATGTDPTGLTDVNGELFFRSLVRGPRGQEFEIWKTDGTKGGTVRLASPLRYAMDRRARPAASGGLYYFVAETAETGRELWKSDGTPEGTGPVFDGIPGRAGLNPGWLTDAGGTLYFTANDQPGVLPPGLWKTDGTAAGTTLVMRGVQDDVYSTAYRPVNLGGTLYFPTADGLWKTDGTEAGTVEVRSSTGGPLGAVQYLTAAGNRLYFQRASYELWTSDGTAAGTVRLSDKFDLGDYVNDPQLVAAGDRLYALGTGHDVALWTSDGTVGGTVRLLKLRSPSRPTDNVPLTLGLLGNQAFFRGYDASAGGELWRSDGTPEGTARFKDLDPSTRSLNYWRATSDAGGGLIFVPHDGPKRADLLRIDATTGGIETLLDEPENGFGAAWLTRLGDSVFFTAGKGGSSNGIWKTDGTPAGTVFVSAAGAENPSYSSPSDLSAAGDTLYFTGPDSKTLWRSDGTAAGTVPLKAFSSGAQVFDQVVGGNVYFSASDPQTGQELWKTDGTPEGTVPVTDLVKGPGSSWPSGFLRLGDKLLFLADTVGASGGPDAVWASDGTEAGTVRLGDTGRDSAGLGEALGSYDGHAYFGAPDSPAGDGGASLWKSDGTPEGTSVLARMPAGQGAPYAFAEAGGLLFFLTTDDQARRWLWRTDGTAAGTAAIRSFDGNFKLPVLFAGDVGGSLLFSADGGEGGMELWRSDGTEAGTELAADIFPGPEGSYPDNFIPVGDAMYFQAGDPAHGVEWRKYTPDPPVLPRVVGRHVFYNHSSFDGNNAAANDADAAARATDKAALRPGDVPTFANVTSFDKGINGLVLDVFSAPGRAWTLDDFAFETASPSSPSGWSPAPSPQSFTARPSGDRSQPGQVKLIWPDGAVVNTWLRVTVKANANTGLASPDVFSFGNLIGETGDGNGSNGWRVNAQDLAAVKRSLNAGAAVAGNTDFNRDGRTNAQDLTNVKRHLNAGLALPSAPALAAQVQAALPPGPSADGTASVKKRLADELLA